MIFEDAFTEKQSEIISMFLEVIGDNVDTIYVSSNRMNGQQWKRVPSE